VIAAPPRTTLLALAAILLLAGCSAGHAGGRRKPLHHPSPSARATVWAVGDGADGGSGAKRVARRIQRSDLDRLLYLGDVYERGTASDFRRNYAPVYGRLARVTAPTPGNHDWPRHLGGYDRYWAGVKGGRPPPYYAFRLAGWKILSLNSESPHGSGSRQLRWLRRQLRGRRTCRLAFWHRPRFSAGLVHGDQADVAPLWEALRGHARIVVNGHEHDMQRFRPRDGITELVSGAGGHGLYPLGHRQTLAYGDDSHYGALRIVLRPGAASFAFVSARGRKLDSGHVRCRR
jgi:acid phosphatase type 7